MDGIQTDQDQNNPTIEPIRFRAGKKRKAYRQRTAEEREEDDATAVSSASVLPGASSLKGTDTRRDADDTGAEAQSPRAGDSEREDDDNGDDDEGNDQIAGESAVAAALRLRNARRAGRRGGVGFRSEGRLASGNDEYSEHALVLREQDRDVAAAHDRIVGGITNRFMHQTGLLTILDDKHIVDTPEGASSQLPPASSSSSTNPHLPSDAGATTAAAGQPDKWRDQPTRHGKLVEVDMTGINDRANNNNNNNNNKRRRVEKDTAKPPPRRGRNRRNSEDIARDALVEQFLHENRLLTSGLLTVDVYDVPASSSIPATSSAPGADPSADDRLAEQFRQQYYDEQALRRKKKRPVQQQQQQKQQQGDVLKGPKLGGSRNMRAAVRDKLLQQEKDKRGK
ncbi:mrna splicing factor rna helicase [Trichoderma arundinaceum]|uniref:Mrna splicing factor rna helicase n=1 Tax=Trichoderma arundinaceum TaxID=490622 RepID=A0A395NJN9_TRIAR|nr:mrna splicing factor rna helicase [Trichoderma arundinaceum]